MKTLKFILGSIYPILIILLLLANIKACQKNKPTDTSEQPVVEPADTTNVVRQAEQTGKSGNLKVTLLWNFEGDIDLHVLQPNGKEIYYDRKTDESTGGALDVDNQDGGNGSAENIYWEEPPKGEYTVSLVYYKESKSTGVAGSGTCKIVVFQEGKEPQTYTSDLSRVKESKNVVKIRIQ